jgi:hypothetical protein
MWVIRKQANLLNIYSKGWIQDPINKNIDFFTACELIEMRGQYNVMQGRVDNRLEHRDELNLRFSQTAEKNFLRKKYLQDEIWLDPEYRHWLWTHQYTKDAPTSYTEVQSQQCRHLSNDENNADIKHIWDIKDGVIHHYIACYICYLQHIEDPGSLCQYMKHPINQLPINVKTYSFNGILVELCDYCSKLSSVPSNLLKKVSN